MAFDLNVNVEDLAGMAKPARKLVEVFAAGCGRLYGPIDIRRTAKAQAAAMITLAEAHDAAAAIQVRTAQRWLHVEERRQANLEAIAGAAARELPEEVDDRPVDPDWAARFFTECQDVGNDQMQAIWGRLLAGEVAAPGSYSQRTLAVLRNLSTDEAQLFNTLCKLSFRGAAPGLYYPLVSYRDAYWASVGLAFPSLQRLDDAGLVHLHPTGLQHRGFTRQLFLGSTISVLVECDSPGNVTLGNVDLTTPGRELASICEWDIPEDRVDAVVRQYSAKPFRVTKVLAEVVGINLFRYGPA